MPVIIITRNPLTRHAAFQPEFKKQEKQNQRKDRFPNLLTKPPGMVEVAILAEVLHQIGVHGRRHAAAFLLRELLEIALAPACVHNKMNRLSRGALHGVQSRSRRFLEGGHAATAAQFDSQRVLFVLCIRHHHFLPSLIRRKMSDRFFVYAKITRRHHRGGQVGAQSLGKGNEERPQWQ